MITAAVIEGLPFGLETVFLWFLIAASVFSYVIFLIYERERQKYNDFTNFRTIEQASKHIEKLQSYINNQETNSKAIRNEKEHFEYEVFQDDLTKLPNRRRFIENLELCLKQSKRVKKYDFAVLSLDLKRFKTINESLGYSLGDFMICKVAERISNLIREKDSVARLGGGEFGIILNNVSRTGDVIACVELMIRSLAEPFNFESRKIYTSVSIGIAIAKSEYAKAEDILRDADIAMYHAKSNEKNYEIFDSTMHTRAITLLDAETDLRNAIDQDGLITFYQPILHLKSMELIGFESLIRWNHPTRGLVFPNNFLPLSEKTNLILPITLWVLRKSCEQMVEWKRKYPNHKHLIMSVNLSGKHFTQYDLVQQIREILSETRMDPTCLKLELTESAIMENAETSIFLLERLREIGVQISIDDFGTGYSSLSYLHRFPINTLKVDQTFVKTVEDANENGEIVRTIIDLANTLNLTVVAEGVETVDQLDKLRTLNCEYGQGYIFSRPVSVSKAERFLQETPKAWNDLLPKGSGPSSLMINNDLPTLEIDDARSP